MAVHPILSEFLMTLPVRWCLLHGRLSLSLQTLEFFPPLIKDEDRETVSDPAYHNDRYDHLGISIDYLLTVDM